MNWIYIIGAVGIVVAFILEDSREWIMETCAYIISFEWWGDLWGFAGEMFEGLGEISIFGIVFGIVGAGTVYLARNYMLKPFLLHMGSFEAMCWGVATYIATFMAGYLLGKGFENT